MAAPNRDVVVLPRLRVDRFSPVPLYYQVSSHLQQLIEDGTLPVGSRLENEIDLADQLGVSRPTMRRAISYLVEQGLLVRKRGVGTQVVRPKVRRPIELSSLYDDLRKSGREPRTEVLSLEVRPATGSLAATMGLAEGTEVTHLDRLRYAGDEPLALMHNVIPLAVLRLRSEDLVGHGLYELLRGAGAEPRMAQEVIGARAATAAEARTLAETRGAPLLTMTRTAWDGAGRVVEYGAHVYRASRYSFELSVHVD
ncbi:MAG: GntR family transcriptional regulator [Actinomycetota bacterium]|nr:GntR family transcriptional regulator [Actinomycetota bacterium]